MTINASLVVMITNNLLKGGFRMALQKSIGDQNEIRELFQSNADYNKSIQRSVMNAVWFGIVFTLGLAPILCFLFITYYEYQGTNCADFKLCLVLYSLACGIVIFVSIILLLASFC